MKKIILIGSGGHASSCIDLINQSEKYKIHGYVDNKKNKSLQFTFLGNDNQLEIIKKKCSNAIIAIGQIKDSKLREKKYKLLKKLNFNLPNIISKNSYIAKNLEIGEGNSFFTNSIINYNSNIGNNNIFNSRSLIEHDVKIGNNNHISTGVIINGNCSIGNNNFIGSGVIINNNVKIGNFCIISSGSIIKNNISDFKIVK